MSELNSIQTFEKVENYNFHPTLDRFIKVLKNISLWNDQLEQEFSDFNWKKEGAFIFNNLATLDYYTTQFGEIKIRPHITVYSKDFDTFNEDWVSIKLLIKTSALRRQTDGQYHLQTFDLVEFITMQMFMEFKQTGTYFADEAQDGADFDGIRLLDTSKLWNFDYAIIPTTFENIYSNYPETHFAILNGNYIESYFLDRWRKPCR